MERPRRILRDRVILDEVAESIQDRAREQTAQPKTRQNEAASASATRDLATLFARLDEVLANQVDPLMEKFLTTDAAFYSEFQTARSIVDATASRERKAEAVPEVKTAPVPLPEAA